jgi:hypothetical protein
MQVIYINQEDRFTVRLKPESCAQYPEGAFSPTLSTAVYAMRIEGAGSETLTYFLVPAGDGTFYWIPMDETHLARR